MYNSHDIAAVIKAQAKQKNIIIKNMLIELNLGSNAMSAMYHGKSIASDSLARIADYLDCSVDYLLGRTNNPNNESPNLPEIIYKFEDLSEERKQEILDFIEFKVHQQENDSNS